MVNISFVSFILFCSFCNGLQNITHHNLRVRNLKRFIEPKNLTTLSFTNKTNITTYKVNRFIDKTYRNIGNVVERLNGYKINIHYPN